MSLQDMLLQILKNKAIQSSQGEAGDCTFVILMDHYPEVTISPSPWPHKPAKDEIIAFIANSQFLEMGPKDLTDSGFRFKMIITASDGKQHSLAIRRLAGILTHPPLAMQ